MTCSPGAPNWATMSHTPTKRTLALGTFLQTWLAKSMASAAPRLKPTMSTSSSPAARLCVDAAARVPQARMAADAEGFGDLVTEACLRPDADALEIQAAPFGLRDRRS